MSTTYIFSVESEHTTARYFENCVGTDDSTTVSYTSKINELEALNENDLFFFVDPAPRHWPVGFERLRCFSAAYLIDVHQDLDLRRSYAPFFDVLFVAQRDYVSFFTGSGFSNVHWLPLALDPSIHQVFGTERDIDLAFVGQLGPRGSFRSEVLNFVLPKFQTNDYKRFHPPREMAAIYARSKIVINASMNGDLNMRFFEALASGAMLVTDRIQNGMPDLFQEGVHFVGYSTVSEAIERVNYYLSHPTERESIANEGQSLALAHHTYSDRWRHVQEVIRSMPDKTAIIRKGDEVIRAQAYAEVFERLCLPSRVWKLLLSSQRDGLLLSRFMFRALARKMNARIRVSPGALRARLGI